MAAIHEIAPDVFRLSIYVPALDMQFNHFLVWDEEPLLFHAGLNMPYTSQTEGVLRSLSDLKPETLAVMHGSSYTGPCEQMLAGLAGVIRENFYPV